MVDCPRRELTKAEWSGWCEDGRITEMDVLEKVRLSQDGVNRR